MYSATPRVVGTNVYYAVATNNMLFLRCKGFDKALPLESNPDRWCTCNEPGTIYKCYFDNSDGTLYGMSGTRIFSTNLATFDAAMPYGFGDSIAFAGGTCTITKAGQTFPASFVTVPPREIRVSNCSNSGNNGMFSITAVGVNTISYTNAGGVNEVSSFTWTVRGTFDSTTSKLLPGTYTAPAIHKQYTFFKLGSVIYISAANGIYTCDWPAGVITLTYGQAGSGAPYRMPQYSRITNISLIYEGATPYILVAAKFPLVNQSKIFLINPATHALDRYIESDSLNLEAVTLEAL
jgi:hypothetical protein